MKARFKPKYNIKKGDNVVVIAGDDKNTTKPRLVKEILVEEGRVIVEGVNIITKHTTHSPLSPTRLYIKNPSFKTNPQCNVVGCYF